MASIAVVLVILSLVHNSWEQAGYLCPQNTWLCSSEGSGDAESAVPPAEPRYAIAFMSPESGNPMAGDISVKVYLRECPTLESISPSWYKLEAISAVTRAPLGQFAEPLIRSEAAACNEGQTIIFGTCRPHPMDLPRTYSWIAPNNHSNDIICFRLTVRDAERGCHIIEECIEYYEYESGMGIPTDELGSQVEQPVQGEHSALSHPPSLRAQDNVERCRNRWNCSGAQQVRFCGSDGQIYMSRCEKKLQECITKEDISLRKIRDDELCVPVPQPEPPCLRWYKILDLLDDWKPACTCEGNYKLIQCRYTSDDEIECWFSYENRGEISGTDFIVDCSPEDPSQLFIIN